MEPIVDLAGKPCSDSDSRRLLLVVILTLASGDPCCEPDVLLRSCCLVSLASRRSSSGLRSVSS